MKERPILFSAPMGRALVSGRKTQTRRVLRPLPNVGLPVSDGWKYAFGTGGWGGLSKEENGGVSSYPLPRCPYGVPGDRLWIKHAADVFPVYFRDIPGWERLYSAGTDGRIYRMDRREPEPLQGSPTSKGYLTVSLSRGTWQTKSVHALVCEAFYGSKPSPASEVRHVDGDQVNNRPENLDWGTRTQNRADRSAHGKGMGESHHAAKLTAADADEIRRSMETQRVLAGRFGVSQGTISEIRLGETWTAREQPPRNTKPFRLWKSSIFMPRWASRITLEVTEVRVQRVAEISEGDAKAEGADTHWCGVPKYSHVGCCGYRVGFRKLWDSINGKRPGCAWADNPWCWAISFTRVGAHGGGA